MNGEPQATGSETSLKSSLKTQPSLPDGQRSSLRNTSIRRSRSLNDGMDIKTPLRRPTEPYTNINDGATLHSCRSCSSFEEDVDEIDERQKLLRFERQETDFSCDDLPREERQTTEFSCYVPTRRNTTTGKNEPIQYYVPSRGPEKNEAFFPRLILQDKDPKTAQYGGSAIKPVITSLGLKMKDVPSRIPTVVAKSSNQQASEVAILRKARQDTEFSCDIPEVNRQETRPTKPSIRSASVPTVNQSRDRKQTQFSCDPSLSPLSETQDVQQNLTRTERISTQFSSCGSSLSPSSEAQDIPATRAQRKETRFSCDVVDVSTSQKPSIVKIQTERQESEFSCVPVPDILGSVKPSLSEAKFLRAETDFSCFPETSFSGPSGGEESLKVDCQSVGVPKIFLQRKKYLEVGSQSVRRDTDISYDFGSMVVEPSEIQELEATIETDLGAQQILTETAVLNGVSIPLPPEQVDSTVLARILPPDFSEKTPNQSGLPTRMKSIAEELFIANNRITTPNIIEDSLLDASEISPKSSSAGVGTVAEQKTPTNMPSRIPTKTDSTVLRSISQQDKPGRKRSSRLRKMSSDSALEGTAKGSNRMSRKSKPIGPSLTNVEVAASKSVPVSPLESPTVKAEAVDKIKPPSLLSGSSKKSGTARHAFLQVSITASNPVDVGLPIPPMLSQDLATASGIGSGLESLAVKLTHTETKSPTGMPNVSSLPMYHTIDRVDLESKQMPVQEQVIPQLDATVSPPPPRPESSPQDKKADPSIIPPSEPKSDQTSEVKNSAELVPTVDSGLVVEEKSDQLAPPPKEPAPITGTSEVSANIGPSAMPVEPPLLQMESTDPKPLIQPEGISLSKPQPSVSNQRQGVLSKLGTESVLVLTSMQLDELIEQTLARTEKCVQLDELIKQSIAEKTKLSAADITRNLQKEVGEASTQESTETPVERQPTTFSDQINNVTIARPSPSPELRLVKSDSGFSLSSRTNSELLVLEGIGLAVPPSKNLIPSRRSVPGRRSADLSLSLQEVPVEASERESRTERFEKRPALWQPSWKSFPPPINQKPLKNIGKANPAPAKVNTSPQLRSDTTSAFQIAPKVVPSSQEVSDLVDTPPKSTLVVKRVSWKPEDTNLIMSVAKFTNDDELGNQNISAADFEVSPSLIIEDPKVLAAAESDASPSLATDKPKDLSVEVQPTDVSSPKSIAIIPAVVPDDPEDQQVPAIVEAITIIDNVQDQAGPKLLDLLAAEIASQVLEKKGPENETTFEQLLTDEVQPAVVILLDTPPVPFKMTATNQDDPAPTVDTPTLAEKLSEQQTKSDPPIEDQGSISETNLKYWGFVPAVVDEVQDVLQDAVQGAFQDAVQKVVQKAMLQKKATNESSTMYRELIAESLDEAARTADQYLRRESEKQALPLPIFSGTQDPDQNFEDIPVESAKIPDQIGEKVYQEDRSLDPEAVPDIQQTIPDNNTVIPSATDLRSYTPSQYSMNLSPRGSESTIRVGGNNVALEEYARLASPSRKSESPVGPTNEPESVLWKAWNTVSGSRINDYAPIPNRRASLEGPNSKRKLSSLVSPTHISRAMSAYRTLSLGSIKERPRETSSYDVEKEGEVSGNDSTVARPLPTITRRRTIQWLRDLLSSNEPYATRLTALPPRIERDRFELQRSETAPTKPVENLYLGATPRPAEQSVKSKDIETFSKTVLDVEQLLSQALVLARQAIEKNKVDVIPVLESAAAVLRNGGPDLNDIPPTNYDQPETRKQEFVSNIFEDRMEVASIHESNGSTYSADRFSIGEDSEADKFEEFPYRNLMNNKEVESPVIMISEQPRIKSWAGWPPTGRAPTPFPPSSMVDSILSNGPGDLEIVRVEEEDGLEQKSAIPAGKVHAVDITELTVIASEQPPAILARQGSVREARLSLPKRLSQVEASSREVKDLDTSTGPNEQSRENNEDTKRDSLFLTEKTYNLLFPKPSRIPSGVEGRPKALPPKREVRNFIKEFNQPPIAPRQSSLKLREIAAERAHSAHTIPARIRPIRTTDIAVKPRTNKTKAVAPEQTATRKIIAASSSQRSPLPSSSLSVDGPQEEMDLGVPQETGPRRRTGPPERPRQIARGEGHEGIPEGKALEGRELKELPVGVNLPTTSRRGARNKKLEELNLRGKSHVSLKEHHKFSLGRSKKRQPIARDWSPGRKRFVAAVNCFSTALIGILIGIYAGQVPSIQYYLADLHHYAILGNVFLFIGLSIPTIFLWPLPLLHGRKPYILASMSIAMPLLFPQAVAVSSIRSPYTAVYRVALLLPRALMGFVLGLANMNFQATLLDLFGASLQSGNPHRDEIHEFDVRRHGGGMGAWLPLWTWCYIGSIGVGFTIGAILINYIAPSLGMYICIIILLFISVLNVLTPEVRRGAYRRSVAEVKTEEGVSRRVARGEVMMHRVQTGPRWFGQELYHGMMLSRDMLKQPGFLVMAVYQAWIYGQYVLLIVLLGSLTSNSYKFKSPLVGASVAALPIGSVCAIPFESGGLFSRARTQAARTNSNTFKEPMSLTSHVFRRALFTMALPFMGLGYTLTSYGQPVPWILPILFAAAFGFLSNMTIAECVGIIMETWDTSDLQPGMTGRPRGEGAEEGKKTNYSSFPRVAAAFGITQGLGFIFAACATAVGGVATRSLGQQAATGVMAGILFILTLMYFAVLIRWQDVQIIPNAKTGEMDLYLAQRRLTAMRAPGAPETEEPWRPTIIGNPNSKTRRMSIIELGSLTRWTEIRRKNRLYDETVAHPDMAVLRQAEMRLQHERRQVVRSVHGSLRSAQGSLRGRLSREGSARGRRRIEQQVVPDDEILGKGLGGDGWMDFD